MRKIKTKALMDEYFENKYPSGDEKMENMRNKTRPQIDRPELYEYEKKIGKQLTEMDADELFEMIFSFNIGYRTYKQIISMYRALFRYYIENYRAIPNPFESTKMNGKAVTQRFLETNEPLSWERVEDIIRQIKEYYTYERANYLECIILLFYNGFPDAQEIAKLSENQIDFKNRVVKVRGRLITLSDRCFELLTYVHGLDIIKGWRTDFFVRSWRGSYFKYIIRQTEEASFDSRTLREIGNLINRKISININKQFNTSINYRNLYLLGFYDSMVEQYGEDRVKEMVLSVRDPITTNELREAAVKYNIETTNITEIRESLKQFIEV